MSMIKSPAEIALMREAGRVVANTLERVREAAAVDVSLKELDELAAAAIADAGATPAFLNYQPRWASVPFPGVICTSVNDAVVHGIP
ncbi:MAG TPA: M24 family metallopeptidase, partial [Arthrobacter sp.]|nr:M24 family metallopeptidase [Arthrobacter sp.]